MTAIYVRQSIDKKDSISIETQIELCKKEAEKDYSVYQDKGFSGKNIKRPGFLQMLGDIEMGSIKKVVVYRLDRISRSITDFANIIEKLEKHKVDFVSISEKFDTSNPAGRAMLFTMMVFAQFERETITERIKDNYYSRGKKGVWLGGPAPFGFDNVKILKDDKKVATLKENENIETVKEIFKLYTQAGASLGSVARIIREQKGGMWNNIKLARIIHNPVYVRADADVYRFFLLKKCIIESDIEEFTGVYGCNLYGKRNRGANKYNAPEEQVLTIGLHEGVIDSETWLKCQRKTETNKQIKNKGKGKHTWLTSLVKCGYCGYGMRVTVHGERKYLKCTGRYSTDLCIEKLETHHLKDIENYVESEIINFFDKYKDREIEPVTKPKHDKNTINDFNIKLIKINQEIESLLKNYTEASDVTRIYIDEKIQKLHELKKFYTEEINATITEKAAILPDIKLDSFKKQTKEYKRNIAQVYINKVLVFNDEIKIIWNIEPL